ncbi:NUDIX hydrolase [Spirilliplanes yamanashiensis]|nr:NUDIX hydrolase [Spirilliplanes yamanashiensis]
MAERAAAFTGPPAPARPAATVVLLRPAPPAFQVYALRRHAAMVFGGVYAFPGGRVDPADTPDGLRPGWGARLGLPDREAGAVVAAAVRELFEETGVLLAAGGEQASEADRAALVARETTLAEVLARRGATVRDDLLTPWSRWITPEFEPRRFDTWFFVAALPPGQEPRDVSGEADRVAWVDPADAGHLTMLPPTAITLAELAGYGTVEAALAADRDAARPVLPQIELGPDGVARIRL